MALPGQASAPAWKHRDPGHSTHPDPYRTGSQAGDQLGLSCPQYGDLVSYIVAILRHHRPRLLIMENVPNLMRHRGGETWRQIREQLVAVGYDVSGNAVNVTVVRAIADALIDADAALAPISSPLTSAQHPHA